MEAFPADCPRVQRIFTAVFHYDEYRLAVEDFPAYSSILLGLANVNLRTVIVTAAVHRGFGSKLRLAANLSP